MKPALSIGTAWVGIAAAFAAILIPLNVPTIWQIKQHMGTSSGIITSVDCANHGVKYYAFLVGTTQFKGRSSFGPDCGSALIGQQITVYYDTRNPSRSLIWDPTAALWNELIPIALACLTFPPLIIWRLQRWRTRRATSASRS